MSAAWWAIIATAAGCYALKLGGLLVPDRMLEHRLTTRIAALIPIGLLGALVAVQTFADGQSLSIDARAIALGGAALMLWLRAPFLVVVFGAAIIAALLRL